MLETQSLTNQWLARLISLQLLTRKQTTTTYYLTSLQLRILKMPVTLYELSIPVFIRSLNNLSAILKKGEAYADEKGIPHAKLLEARLVDDMQALPYQIQRCSDSAKGAAVRVAGVQPVAMADNETTFEDLQARIQKTIDFLKSVETTSMDGKDESPVVLRTAAGEVNFTATRYLLDFALPNFFFHVATAYGILVSDRNSQPVMLCCLCFAETVLFCNPCEKTLNSLSRCRAWCEDHTANCSNRGIWACRLGRRTFWGRQTEGCESGRRLLELNY